MANVNYEDERLTQVETDKQAALSEIEKTYGGMVNQSDQFYQAQIDASKEWADKQTQLQQEQTDFAIEQINQQKEQAQKDYAKEQSGAYVDYKKQSSQYGVNAEQMAANGMTGTGFAESSQVAMYNTYQNRVVAARESYNKAVLNYESAIKDAVIQNNAALAEIAFQALQTQLELSLEGFQYENNLILDQTNKKLEVDNMYYSRYQDVLSQINTENALAEQQRQYDQDYMLQMKEYEEGIRQFNEELARLKANDEKSYRLEIQQMEYQKQQMELEKQQLEEEKRQFDAQMAEEQRQFDASQSGKQSSIYKGAEADEEDEEKSSPVTEALGLPVDQRSILGLGMGTLTPEQLDTYIRLGVIEEYEEDGKLKYRRAANFPFGMSTGGNTKKGKVGGASTAILANAMR